MSEQKLHVFASSRRDTRKSSNVSPSCCTHRRAFDRFVYLSLDIAFNRRDDVLDFAALSNGQAEVVDNYNGFP